MRPDDATLLRRYAVERSGAAFVEFVGRHLPLVYSAAVRRLGGDTHRAQDVAQTVFCAVARDARSLSEHTVLTGWLYTATRNAVIDVQRAESRRRREEEANAMQTTLTDHEVPIDWSRLRPVLDTAMDDLGGDDRGAVLLRFFENKPFAEIGAALGLSEDAARKRVDRALDKLRDILGRHRIASTSAALATLLAAETVTAAPATLAASITSAALATGAAAAGAGAFFTLAKLKVGVAAALVVGAGAVVVTQRQEIAALREDRANTQSQLAKLATENAALTQARADSEAAQARLRAGAAAAPATRSPGSAGRAPGNAIAPSQAAGALVLGPLPDTPEIRKQRADWQRRYAPFFQQRGLTAAQGDRFVELKIHQAIERQDFQAAVRAANLRGDSHAVQALRAKDVSPITRARFELLGREGYEAYGKYEVSSGYRMAYVEPMLPAFASARVPLSPQQAEQMIAVFAASSRQVQARPTDIGTLQRMGWDAVVARAGGFLTAEQLAVLRNYARDRK